MAKTNLSDGNPFRIFATLAALAAGILLAVIMAVGSASAASSDTTAPTITGVSPAAKTTDVSISTKVRATFSEKMNPQSVNGKTFKLFYKSGTQRVRVAALVRCNLLCRTATLRPKSTLKPATRYVAVIVGGDNGVKDLAGNALAKNKGWSFLTTSATTTDVTKPAITLTTPANGATYALNQDVKADYACQDEAGGSALKSCEGTVANGTSIDTASAGQKSFTVTATDNAGNTTSVTHTYRVSECTILGTEGNDVLDGTAGDDVICGFGGKDVIKGLGGNDTIKGGADNDTALLGGEGDDTIEGGDGYDTASFENSVQGIEASLMGNTATGEGNDQLVDIERLFGSIYDDTLIGNDYYNRLTGNSGNDTLKGLDGADSLYGWGGQDTIYGGLSRDTLRGSTGPDKLFGEEGNDALNSQDGVEGNDSLDGGAGTDTMETDATEASIVNIP
jgi:hypothetical protein